MVRETVSPAGVRAVRVCERRRGARGHGARAYLATALSLVQTFRALELHSRLLEPAEPSQMMARVGSLASKPAAAKATLMHYCWLSSHGHHRPAFSRAEAHAPRLLRASAGSRQLNEIGGPAMPGLNLKA